MILSQSYVIGAALPVIDMTVRRGDRDIILPAEIDLRSPSGFAHLRRIDAYWPELSDSRRQAWLRQLDIVLPPRQLAGRDIALLPGGAVTVRDTYSIRVCDPAEAVTFNETDTKRLHRTLGTRADVETLSHTDLGAILGQRVPKSLPPQAVTIVPDGARLPIRTGLTGAVMIQWNQRGAVAWPLVEAPPTIALATSIAAAPITKTTSRRPDHVWTIPPETWLAEDADARRQLIAPALAEHAADVIGDIVCDELRFALIDSCVEGSECLARRIADSLEMLPSCFLENPDAVPGGPPAVWQRAMMHIRESDDNMALLGLDDLASPVAAIRGLRDLIEDAEVMAFAENGEPLSDTWVPLHGDAAMFLARKAGTSGRLGVNIATPALPVDLYALAHDAAAATGARVIAVAPCWGFCHRISSDHEESGNAGWFGMGTGLDEMDVLFTAFERCA